MGTEELEMNAIVPTSQQGDWTGRYTTEKPAGDWTSAGYDDSKWKSDRGAFGTKENEPTAKTQWGTRNIWVRRMVNIDRDLTGIPVYLEFSNDDDAVFYINGVKIHGTGTTCNKNKVVKLPDEALAVLKQGDNIIAAECINPVGNGLLDFGLQIPETSGNCVWQYSRADLCRRAAHADTLRFYLWWCRPESHLHGTSLYGRPEAAEPSRELPYL